MSGPCAGGARRVGESRSLSDHEYSARVAGPHETPCTRQRCDRSDRSMANWTTERPCAWHMVRGVAGRLRSATGTAESALTSTALLLSVLHPHALSFFSRWEHTGVEYSEIRGSYVIQRRRACTSRVLRLSSLQCFVGDREPHGGQATLFPQHIIPILDLPSPSPTSQLCCQLRGGLGECL
jgi:hypothetical protein